MRNVRTRNSHSCAILGIGKVNLKTGKCKYFNIFETWDGTVEVWRINGTTTSKNLRLVFTAGSNSMYENGSSNSFHQDQTGRSLPSMTKIDGCRVKDMPSLIATHGNKIPGFTYK